MVRSETLPAPRGRSGSAVDENQILEELLDAEVAVHVTKLMERAKQGIPPSYRGHVYRYLLGVAFVDKSSEMTIESRQEKDFGALLQSYEQLWGPLDGHGGGGADGANGGGGGVERWRAYLSPSAVHEAHFFLPDDSRSYNGVRCITHGTSDSHMAWQRVIFSVRRREHAAAQNSTAMNVVEDADDEADDDHHGEGGTSSKDATVRYPISTALAALQIALGDLAPDRIRSLATLALPFGAIFVKAKDIFYCLGSMLHILSHHRNVLQDDACLQHHCGHFMMLFHAVNAPLYQHFFAEGVPTSAWVPSMLTSLLADALHPDDLLRLWDYYMADLCAHGGVPLHPFVCLAALAYLTEDLIECEKMEILYRLRHMPRMDAAGLLQKAISIRESVNASKSSS